MTTPTSNISFANVNYELAYTTTDQQDLDRAIVRQLSGLQPKQTTLSEIALSADLGNKIGFSEIYAPGGVTNTQQVVTGKGNRVISTLDLQANSTMYSPDVAWSFVINTAGSSDNVTAGDITIVKSDYKNAVITLAAIDTTKTANVTVTGVLSYDSHTVNTHTKTLTLSAEAVNTDFKVSVLPGLVVNATGIVAQTATALITASANDQLSDVSYVFKVVTTSGFEISPIIGTKNVALQLVADSPNVINTGTYDVTTDFYYQNAKIASNTVTISMRAAYVAAKIVSLTTGGNVTENNVFSNSSSQYSTIDITAIHDATNPQGTVTFAYSTTGDAITTQETIAVNTTASITRLSLFHDYAASGFGMKKAVTDVTATLKWGTTVVDTKKISVTQRAGTYGLNITAPASVTASGRVAQTATTTGSISWGAGTADPYIRQSATGPVGTLTAIDSNSKSIRLTATTPDGSTFAAASIVNAASFTVGTVLTYDGVQIVDKSVSNILVSATTYKVTPIEVSVPSASNTQISSSRDVTASIKASVSAIDAGCYVTWTNDNTNVSLTPGAGNTTATVAVTAPGWGSNIQSVNVTANLYDSTDTLLMSKSVNVSLSAVSYDLQIRGGNVSVSGAAVPQVASGTYEATATTDTNITGLVLDPPALSSSDAGLTKTVTKISDTKYSISISNPDTGTKSATYTLTARVNVLGQSFYTTKNVALSAQVDSSTITITKNEDNAVKSSYIAQTASAIISATTDLSGGVLKPVNISAPGATVTTNGTEVTISYTQSDVGSKTIDYSLSYELSTSGGTYLKTASTTGSISAEVKLSNFKVTDSRSPTSGVSWSSTTGVTAYTPTGTLVYGPNPNTVSASVTYNYEATSALTNPKYIYSISVVGDTPTTSFNETTGIGQVTGTSTWTTTSRPTVTTSVVGIKAAHSSTSNVSVTLKDSSGNYVIGPINKNAIADIGMLPGQPFDLGWFTGGYGVIGSGTYGIPYVRQYDSRDASGCSNNRKPCVSSGLLNNGGYQVKWMGAFDPGWQWEIDSIHGGRRSTGQYFLDVSGVRWYYSQAMADISGYTGPRNVVQPGTFILETFNSAHKPDYDIYIVSSGGTVYQLDRPYAVGGAGEGGSADCAFALYTCGVSGSLAFINDGSSPSTYRGPVTFIPKNNPANVTNPLLMPTLTLPDGKVNEQYSPQVVPFTNTDAFGNPFTDYEYVYYYDIYATGGTQKYSSYVIGGSGLPGGLSSSSIFKTLADGTQVNGIRIEGIPTSPETKSFTITVADSAGTTAVGTYSIAVSSFSLYMYGPCVMQMTQNGQITAEGVTGRAYTTDLDINGVVGPGIYAKDGYSQTDLPWTTPTISYGSLPPGLSISKTDYGVTLLDGDAIGITISGTPTQAGSYSFTIRANSGAKLGEQAFVINVKDGGAGGTGTTGGTTNNGSPSSFTLTADTSAVNEGSTVTFYVTADNLNNIGNGYQLPYTITGISAADLLVGSLTGNFTVDSVQIQDIICDENSCYVNQVTRSSGSLLFTLANDLTTEGAETMTLKLDGTTTSVAVTINDTSVSSGGGTTTPNAKYSLSSSATSVTEGDVFTITLTTTNLSAGTVVPYSITGATSADINDASLTGSFKIGADGTATASFTTTKNTVYNGTRVFALSAGGVSTSVNIVDAAATYSLSASATAIEEGQSIQFTLTATSTAPGTQFAYQITGISPGRLSSTEGNVTIGKNGTGSVSVAPDKTATSEGIENGTIVFTSLQNISAKFTVTDPTTTTPNPQIYLEIFDQADNPVSQVYKGAQFKVKMKITNWQTSPATFNYAITQFGDKVTISSTSGSVTLTNGVETTKSFSTYDNGTVTDTLATFKLTDTANKEVATGSITLAYADPYGI